MKSLRLAIGFLTIFPLAPSGRVQMGPSRAWFPLVGLALGGILAGLDLAAREALPPMVVGSLLVVALLVLTRAIHTEGFLDTCDGLLGGDSPSRRLEILRDSHVGAFAVVGGAGLLLLKWALLTSIEDDLRLGLLLVFPCLSRLGIVSAMAVFPYARQQGLGTSFQSGRARWQVGLAFATAAVAGGLFLGFGGLVLLGAALGVALGLGWWVTRLLGGMTGDTYGAVNEVAEVVVLLLGLILFEVSAVPFDMPFW